MLLIEFEKLVFLELKLSTGRHNCFNFPPLLSILASRPGKKHWALETLPTYERDLYIMSGLRLCHVQIENCSKKNTSFASEIFVRGRFCFGKLILFAQVSPGDHCLYAHNAMGWKQCIKSICSTNLCMHTTGEFL